MRLKSSSLVRADVRMTHDEEDTNGEGQVAVRFHIFGRSTNDELEATHSGFVYNQSSVIFVSSDASKTSRIT